MAGEMCKGAEGDAVTVEGAPFGITCTGLKFAGCGGPVDPVVE